MGVFVGTTTSHRELEEMVARFLGKEECIVFNMGYGTNATTIPALCSAVRPHPRSLLIAAGGIFLQGFLGKMTDGELPT